MRLTYTKDGHVYTLKPDTGRAKRCKSASKVADALDDKYHLEAWKQRQIVIGLASSPELIAQVKDFQDDNQAVNKIIGMALGRAKSDAKSTRGTQIHALLERHDLEGFMGDNELDRAIILAWDRLLEGCGLAVVPELIERVIVYPEHFIAGRFDRIVKRKRDGRFFVLDIKTGANAIEYANAPATQLGLYANAPFMSAPIPEEGGSTEEFEPLPKKLDKKTAYIFHVPAPELGTEATLYPLDITKAYATVEKIILPMYEWRKTSGLVGEPLGSITLESPFEPASEERAEWIRARLAILALDEDAKTWVRARWPKGVKGKGPWTSEDIDRIDECLSFAERESIAGFTTPDPVGSDMRSD